MKNTTKTQVATSFHDDTVTASLEQMTQAFGTPEYHTNAIDEKTQNEWTFETDDGEVFTIYDWKQYRHYTDTEPIHWHIGAKTPATTRQARLEIEARLKKEA